MGEEFEKQLNELKKNISALETSEELDFSWGIDLVKDRHTREPDQKLALSSHTQVEEGTRNSSQR
ncbi:hypothetical protein KIN20_011266 [Parelaphostrongylus tenuis]|uniref:Uncharacterized protein n=1 Tax=Parelaphostrongylus tenuis TaxID=148309 RepID=A0AAD5MCK7_PARTN|nr:hypothetical protein KIN20_011266 [Parelaphostrongylus tenuis]